jgi:hypothetical protein
LSASISAGNAAPVFWTSKRLLGPRHRARGTDERLVRRTRFDVTVRRVERRPGSRHAHGHASVRWRSVACARASVRTSSAGAWAPDDRRSSFHVPMMISFCSRTRSSLLCPPAAIAWLCASANSSTNGVTSRKKMSLRDSVGFLPRPMSRARA